MFDLPELDDLVIRQLNRYDLVQCARVSRTWHRIVVPYLWAVFDCTTLSQRRAFYKLVLQSYLLERHCQELKTGECDTGQHTQVSTIPLPPLAKYGRWVRHLPYPDTLRTLLKPPLYLTQVRQGPNEAYDEPTAYDLMRHLYKHCPAFQVQYLYLTSKNVKGDDYLKTIAKYVTPRTHHLHLQVRNRLEVWRLMHLLDYGSSMLESLILEVHVFCDGDKSGDGGGQRETEPWKLKRLDLWRCKDSSESKTFWSWLWKQCGQVERLEVKEVFEILQSLVKGIRTHMPKLDKLILTECHLRDDAAAALLSSSHHGWKEISLVGETATSGGSAKEALMQQCPVLEKLVLDRCDHFSSHDAVQVLASSPNLHTFSDVTESMFRTTRINATLFADRDLNSGSLKAWDCEGSLTTLRVRITGVPRPDLEECQVQERYLGEGRGIQSQVYERLARLTRLETLWLGETLYQEEQYDCLEMSLESGLHRLSGLKSLKELGVMSLVMKIGVKEVQWMADNWPQLRTIHGIHGMRFWDIDTRRRAVEWLQQNRPEIELKYM
ncbi:MAG: hypothetical protein J3Q66DRAFT_372787 [Benniella sp.]|nr:MAG: hypothetical protein J3Q66DRAFT_372787 [Benniella sp.]